MFYRTFTTTTCFPLPVTLDGSFTSEGDIVTLYNTNQVIAGDLLYSSANNELRKIMSFNADGKAILDSAFTVDVSVAVPIKIADKSIKYTKASIMTFGAADGELNGYATPSQSTINVDTGDIYFTIDGTGTTMAILAQ